VPIYNLMEDAATAEICRAQVWQWMRHGAKLEDNRTVTPAMVCGMIHRHVEKLSKHLPQTQLFTAARLFDELVNSRGFPDLTLSAYDHLA